MSPGMAVTSSGPAWSFLLYFITAALGLAFLHLKQME